MLCVSFKVFVILDVLITEHIFIIRGGGGSIVTLFSLRVCILFKYSLNKRNGRMIPRGAYLVLQWLRLRVPNLGGPGFHPWSGS